MKIAVFGLGYVGAVTAALLAEKGHTVVGVDSNPGKVDMIRKGRSPIVEPQLPERIAEAVQAGRLIAVSNPDLARGWDAAFVCVGTPAAEGGQVDQTALRAVLTDIAAQIPYSDGYPVIALRSTVLPHIVRGLVLPFLKSQTGMLPGTTYGLAVTPEFLREGCAVNDFLNPAFTLIGESDSRAGDLMAGLFGFLSCPILRLDIGEAAMVKYASNAFHALKVVFANEIALVCSQDGIDASQVMEAFSRDTKLNISSRYLSPGFAFGGSCLPKDVRALNHRARQLDLNTPLLNAILPGNRTHLEQCIDVVLKTGRHRVGVFGISFKPGTDDLRESPMITLVETLIGKGLQISVYDKAVSLTNLTGANRRYIEETIPHIASLLKPTMKEVLDASEVLVTGNNDPEFNMLPSIKKRTQVLIDFSRPLLSNAKFRSRRPGHSSSWKTVRTKVAV